VSVDFFEVGKGVINAKTCNECGLCKTGVKTWKVPTVTTTSNSSVDVMLVGGSPTEADDVNGYIFSSEDGEVLAPFLEQWSANGGTYAFSAAVRCATKKPTEEQVLLCREYLARDIAKLRPKVVIALGGIALQTLWPEGPKSINEARKRVFNAGPYYLLTTYHPSYHLRGNDCTEEYARIFTRAAELIEGIQEPEPDIRLVESGEDLAAARKQILRSDVITFDCEWGSPRKAKEHAPDMLTFWMPKVPFVCAGFGTSLSEPVWVVPRRFMSREWLSCLKQKVLSGHNIHVDVNCLAHYYEPYLWLMIKHVQDTMMQFASLDLGKIGNSLESLCDRLMGIENWKGAAWEAAGQENERLRALKQKPIASLADIPISLVADMNGRDVFNTMRLQQYADRNIEVPPVYEALLRDAIWALGRTTLNGLPADDEYRAALGVASARWAEEILRRMRKMRAVREVEKTLDKRFNGVFSPASPLCQYALVKTTGAVVHLRTKTGKPQLDKKEVLPELAAGHNAWKYLVAFKDWDNLGNKFLTPLQHHIVDGRIHGEYALCKTDRGEGESGVEGTVTGRLACLRPNLQQLKKDPTFRQLFRPRPGYIFAEFDFCQVEVRIAAWMSQSKKLMDACLAGDIYQVMGQQLWHLPAEECGRGTKRRDLMKVGVLAMIYRETPKTFAHRNKLPLHEAEEFHKTFHHRFPELREWQQVIIQAAYRGELIRTPWGRQRSFEFGGSTPDWEVENQASNYPIQSTASDCTLWKLIRTFRENQRLIPVNVVHDAIWAEIPLSVVMVVGDKQVALMREMDYPFEIPIPLDVEDKYGPSLGEIMGREKFQKWLEEQAA